MNGEHMVSFLWFHPVLAKVERLFFEVLCSLHATQHFQFVAVLALPGSTVPSGIACGWLYWTYEDVDVRRETRPGRTSVGPRLSLKFKENR